jgi:hypothetical protein
LHVRLRDLPYLRYSALYRRQSCCQADTDYGERVPVPISSLMSPRSSRCSLIMLSASIPIHNSARRKKCRCSGPHLNHSTAAAECAGRTKIDSPTSGFDGCAIWVAMKKLEYEDNHPVASVQGRHRVSHRNHEPRADPWNPRESKTLGATPLYGPN